MKRTPPNRPCGVRPGGRVLLQATRRRRRRGRPTPMLPTPLPATTAGRQWHHQRATALARTKQPCMLRLPEWAPARHDGHRTWQRRVHPAWVRPRDGAATARARCRRARAGRRAAQRPERPPRACPRLWRRSGRLSGGRWHRQGTGVWHPAWILAPPSSCRRRCHGARPRGATCRRRCHAQGRRRRRLGPAARGMAVAARGVAWLLLLRRRRRAARMGGAPTAAVAAVLPGPARWLLPRGIGLFRRVSACAPRLRSPVAAAAARRRRLHHPAPRWHRVLLHVAMEPHPRGRPGAARA